jgi:hypothetical protein
MNLSLYSVRAFIILDSEGQRVLAKYYRPKNHPGGEPAGLLTLKEQRTFEKGLWQKTKKPGGTIFLSSFSPSYSQTAHSPGDIILYDSHLAVYKHSLDLILYIIAGQTENELMLSSALHTLSDALTMLLRNQVEKRGVLENLDLVVLCLDETIDDGYVCIILCFGYIHTIHYTPKGHHGHGFDGDRVESEPTENGYDGDRLERADDYERVQYGEGEGTATDGAVLRYTVHGFGDV